MIPNPKYWRAVANGIDAEEQKASCFVTHNLSLGIAREEILRALLVRQTPEPYRVSTGFIYQAGDEPYSSKQCDVLVYDPTIAQPYYAIGGLSVVPRNASKLVIEVKTKLNARTFNEMLGVWKTTSWLPVPTLGFAYDGLSFAKFLKHVSKAIRDNDAGIPDCIAVHRQNYLVVRSEYVLAKSQKTSGHHRPAKFHFAVNFGGVAKDDGRASAAFLTFYDRLLRNNYFDSQLLDWFNQLDLPKEGLIRITNDGVIAHGPEPEVTA